MTNLIKAELYKLRKRTITLVLLLIMIGIIIVMVLLMQGATGSDGNAAATLPVNTSLLSQVIPAAMMILSSFGTVLAVIMVASAVGNEYSWHTIRPYLLCTESRWKMLAAKLISAGILILAGMVIGVITAVLMGLMMTAIRGFSWDLNFFTLSFVGNQFLNFLRTFYVILPYTLLAVLFTVLGRSTVAGMGFGIGLFFLEPVAAELMRGTFGWVSKIPNYLLYSNVQALNSLNNSPLTIHFDSNIPMSGIPRAIVTLAIYSLVFITIAFTLFRRRDVTA